MESSHTISIRIFFVFIFWTYSSVKADLNENRDENTDWKWAVKTIQELEQKVKVQDERIATLEKRPTGSDWTSMVDLKKTIQKQNDRIIMLEDRIYELEATSEVENNDSIKESSPLREIIPHSEKQTDQAKSSPVRKGRLLIQPTTVPFDRVAFYAYFSSDILASMDNYILPFNTVVTNVGNAYHPHSGTFIAPRSGLYVFTWTIRAYGSRYHSTQLLVDNNVINTIYINPNSVIDGSVTGTAVVHVDQGDDVFIRTFPPNSGEIISGNNGRSSFCGWSLM
uniref:Uncharacterized protein LOC111105398 n=1 Tax=Crassostrea virginica TaxID=6565 RepID=A0A8B8AXD0_CRAVI|nr:uncharacterized protein LOC111105398 [Crassostrea virginica]